MRRSLSLVATAASLVAFLSAHPACSSFDSTSEPSGDAGTAETATPEAGDLDGAASACRTRLVYAKVFAVPEGTAAKILGLATDLGGEATISGTTDGTLDFGGGPISDGVNGDGFVARFDADGKYLSHAVVADPDIALSTLVARVGKYEFVSTYLKGQTKAVDDLVYTTGSSFGSVVSQTAGGSTPLVRFFNAPSGGTAQVVALKAVGSSSVYAFGDWTTSLALFNSSVSSTTNSGGTSALFLARLFSSAPAEKLAILTTGPGAAYAEGLATESSGGAYLTGSFTGDVTFGTKPLTAQGGTRDGYVVRVNAELAVTWVTTFSGAGTELVTRAVPAPGGGVIVAGLFDGKLSTPSGDLTADAERDVFVARLDENGGVVWVKQLGGTGAAGVAGLEVHTGCEAIVVTGNFTGPTFDVGGRVVQNKDPSKGEGFVALLSASDGATLDAAALGGAGEQRITATAVDATGGLALAGTLDDPFEISPGTPLTPIGTKTLWLARLMLQK